MRIEKWLPFVAMLGCASTPSVPAIDPATVPRELTPSTYDRVKELVRLRPGDLQFQAVNWHSTAYEGIRESQRTDKPLLLWLYFGGPRGAC
ncbi:MAG: hypothetical protein RMA76_13540 [Deltaproteobacteria bacterium]